MSAATQKAIAVIAGIGNGTGVGASSARLFAKNGYRIALIARDPAHLRTLADEINAAGGEAEPFPIKNYGVTDIQSAFSSINSHFPSSEIRVAIYNAGEGTFKKFLDVTDEDIERSTTTGVVGPFAFSRAAITAFRNNELSDPSKHPNEGARKRGTLIFTGATAALRGNTFTSIFSVTKFALRSLSQSLSKEFGPENIHVAHSIIDGGILTDRSRVMRNDPQWETNSDARLHPDSIAKAYKYLVEQDSSALTWELDLRPAHEKWSLYTSLNRTVSLSPFPTIQWMSFMPTYVYDAVRQIPTGKVTTYGHIAKLVGKPTYSRHVGQALKWLSPNIDPPVPWQRVIASSGTISSRGPGTDGAQRQRDALEAEGVEVIDGRTGEMRVDLRAYGWFPNALEGQEGDEDGAEV